MPQGTDKAMGNVIATFTKPGPKKHKGKIRYDLYHTDSWGRGPSFFKATMKRRKALREAKGWVKFIGGFIEVRANDANDGFFVEKGRWME